MEHDIRHPTWEFGLQECGAHVVAVDGGEVVFEAASERVVVGQGLGEALLQQAPAAALEEIENLEVNVRGVLIKQ